MNILFIYTNINGFHDDCYSFGLASIVSVTRAEGHDARVLIVRSREEYANVLNAFHASRPDVVGFTSVSSQFSFVTEIARLIKTRFPDSITVCGGIHATINPECIMRAGALDALFVGESEYAFLEFLKKLEKGEDYKDTDNLAFVDNGRCVVNRLKPLIKDLDTLPFPDKEVYPFQEGVRKYGYAHLLFSRGCPYSCSYCSNHAIAERYGIARNHPRYRSVESSLREIEEVSVKFSPRRIIIGDDVFGLDRKWREEFCREYPKRVKMKFSCLLRANIVNEEFVRMLKSAGCDRVSIGIESGNDHVRNDIMNRKMSSEQITAAFDLARKYGFQTNAINIIGVPGETEEMLWDTIRLNRRVKPTSSGVNIFYPYKGTKLGDWCFEQGLVNEDKYYTFSNERRETILNYPDDYKKRLSYYMKNWEYLVYPFDVKRRILNPLRKTAVWPYVRAVKRKLTK